MKILLVTDAWHPQKNGVVITLTTVLRHLPEAEVAVVHPGVPEAKQAFQIYHDVALVRNPSKVVARYVEAFRPERIHLVTEGPLGVAARQLCTRRAIPFTTSYHTQLPEYGWHLYRIPPGLTRTFLRWFHRPSLKVLVPTASLVARLGYRNAVVWGRGVDVERFHPLDRPRPAVPTVIYVGRVSREKNLEVFCGLKRYRRVLVGDGPHLPELRRRFPDVTFAGHVAHERLLEWYAEGDVFVFPSKTDTFGLVMLEAMACGLPVVGYDVTGPKDVVQQGITGFVGDDLAGNVAKALKRREELSRGALAYAREQSWPRVAEQFARHVCWT